MKKALIIVAAVVLVLINIFAVITCLDAESRVTSLAKKNKELTQRVAVLEERVNDQDDLWNYQIAINENLSETK